LNDFQGFHPAQIALVSAMPILQDFGIEVLSALIGVWCEDGSMRVSNFQDQNR
jgi:hypothetical protein